MPDSDLTITPISIQIEFTVDDIRRARERPSLIDRKLEAVRRLVDKEHARRWDLYFNGG